MIRALALAAAALALAGCATRPPEPPPCSEAWIDQRVSPAVAAFADDTREEVALLSDVVRRWAAGDARSLVARLDIMRLRGAGERLLASYDRRLKPVVDTAIAQCAAPDKVRQIAEVALRRSGLPEQALAWLDQVQRMLAAFGAQPAAARGG